MIELGGAPTLRVAHHHPGRLRLRSARFHEARAADHAARTLGAIDGVCEVATNPRTRGVLVLYDPARIGPDALVEAAARASGLVVVDPSGAPGAEEHLIDVAIDVVREINAFAAEVTKHRADLRFLVPAALAGAGVWSLVVTSERRLPAWDTLLYWAYSVFSLVNAHEIERKTASPP